VDIDGDGRGSDVSVHSPFTIPPGRPFVVTNECRVDVVLYVTTVAGEAE